MRTIIALILLIFSNITLATEDGPPVQPVVLSEIVDANPAEINKLHYKNPKSYLIDGKRYYVLDSNETRFQKDDPIYIFINYKNTEF